jgi:hypothetical protein
MQPPKTDAVPSSQYLAGDWNGDGKDKLAVRQGNQLVYQVDISDAARTATNYGNGNLEDQYRVGDWTGDGSDKLAVRRGNQIIYQTQISDTVGTAVGYGNGKSEDQYLVGDWTGDGSDKLAVRRGNQIIYQAQISDAVGTAVWFGHGNSEDQYLVGDWNGDGSDKLAVRRGNQIIYQEHISDTVGTAVWYGNGKSEDQYLVGDWNGDGSDKLAVRRGNQIIYQAQISDTIGTAVSYEEHYASLNAWLTTIRDSTLITEISLPGTHDSAAINSWLTGFYDCHFTSITDQLTSGVRLLDVRLKVNPDPGGLSYSFVTCHGDIGYNEYQSFVSLMNECQAFLEANPTEFIAMLLKVDDWNGASDVVSTAHLESFVETTPAGHGTGPGLFPGEDQPIGVGVSGPGLGPVSIALQDVLRQYPVNTLNTAVPTLAQVRGKIYLINRINNMPSLGVPLDWPDNTSGTVVPPGPSREFSVYVQDQYAGLPVIGPEGEKSRLFMNAMKQRKNGQMLLNFASATYSAVTGVYIWETVLRSLGTQSANIRPNPWGWSLWDYETGKCYTPQYGPITCVPMIVDANFNCRTFRAPFTVREKL